MAALRLIDELDPPSVANAARIDVYRSLARYQSDPSEAELERLVALVERQINRYDHHAPA